MDRSSETLGADVHMNNHALRLTRQAGVAISHRECDHLIGACDYLGEGFGVVGLAIDDGF